MLGIDLALGEWLLVVGLGALVGLDGVSWPQAMISRPIVSATLGGALFGDAAGGFLTGVILELLGARYPPYGAARYPETGPAGLMAGAGYALAGAPGILPLVAAALAGWAVAWIGSYTIRLQRRLNGRLVGDPHALAGDPRLLVRRHRMAMWIDAARAALITAAFHVPVALGARLAAELPAGARDGRLAGILLAAALAGLGGAGARVLGGRRSGWIRFAAGAGAGAGALLVGGLS